MEWIDSLHWEGILIGICTFLIIGLFHPVVVKAEYYWGTRCWWIFLLLGIAGLIGSVLAAFLHRGGALLHQKLTGLAHLLGSQSHQTYAGQAYIGKYLSYIFHHGTNLL